MTMGTHKKASLVERLRAHATQGLLAIGLSGYAWFFIDRSRLLSQVEMCKVEVDHEKHLGEQAKRAHEEQVESLKQMLARSQQHSDFIMVEHTIQIETMRLVLEATRLQRVVAR